MSCAATVGFYADSKRICPEYLGYVSSLAQESPYFDLPRGAVNPDGIERVRILKQWGVRPGGIGEGSNGNRQLRLGTVGRTRRAPKGVLYE